MILSPVYSNHPNLDDFNNLLQIIQIWMISFHWTQIIQIWMISITYLNHPDLDDSLSKWTQNHPNLDDSFHLLKSSKFG